ncbi:hypothetical protein C6B38_02150 [Spiroplasma sp. ChiS]|uniref:lipoprotein n=1 Tax=Spiroplasma sp. ChiS TaxID=2099885 RepID=UPI000CF83FDD|nr:lipoprotein [Spiroplasma sp. ChiS]PQP79177.1 hypothetical protein C6B38_02150 [Spiroplasma sp. ChiS]
MKRLLSIIGAITLLGTSTTNVVACNAPQEYTSEELKELKEKNKIDTADENIKNNLEWIAPQEKPFNTVDNKWYYVVWRSKLNSEWRIIKFKNDTKVDKENKKIIDVQNKSELSISVHIGVGYSYVVLFINNNLETTWKNNNKNYFKSVYRWNLDTQEPNLDIDKDGNVKVKEK